MIILFGIILIVAVCLVIAFGSHSLNNPGHLAQIISMSPARTKLIKWAVGLLLMCAGVALLLHL
jgi:threonine/homoserine/homoserine lactone efflux protein